MRRKSMRKSSSTYPGQGRHYSPKILDISKIRKQFNFKWQQHNGSVLFYDSLKAGPVFNQCYNFFEILFTYFCNLCLLVMSKNLQLCTENIFGQCLGLQLIRSKIDLRGKLVKPTLTERKMLIKIFTDGVSERRN